MPVNPPVFIATGQQDDGQLTVPNHAFFPSISLLEFQQRYNVNDKTPVPKQLDALRTAIGWVNSDLFDPDALDQPAGIDDTIKSWVEIQQQYGYESLSDVPDLPHGNAEQIYLTAVHSKAKAELLDDNQDVDQTRSGTRADEVDFATSIDRQRENHLTQARESIRALMNKPRCTIELI